VGFVREEIGEGYRLVAMRAGAARSHAAAEAAAFGTALLAKEAYLAGGALVDRG
jgi:hypothetical protein